jgi:hypothetical protein
MAHYPLYFTPPSVSVFGKGFWFIVVSLAYYITLLACQLWPRACRSSACTLASVRPACSLHSQQKKHSAQINNLSAVSPVRSKSSRHSNTPLIPLPVTVAFLILWSSCRSLVGSLFVALSFHIWLCRLSLTCLGVGFVFTIDLPLLSKGGVLV